MAMGNDRGEEPLGCHNSGQEDINGSRIPRYDLCSVDVIIRLQAGEGLLMHAISSRVYQRILEFIAPEAMILGQWKELDEKLKATVRTHIEVFGSLFALEDSIVEILGSDAAMLSKLLKNLSSELHFLFLDISTFFYDYGLSMWNFVSNVEPEYYEPFATMPSLLGEVITGEEPCQTRRVPDPRSDLAERLIAVGLPPDSAQAAQSALLEFLVWSRSYRKVIMLLYETETGIDSLFAFNHATAMAIRLMGISYSSRLVLRAIAMDPAIRAAEQSGSFGV